MTTFKPELKAQQLQVLESRKHDLAITIKDNDFQPLFSYFMKIIYIIYYSLCWAMNLKKCTEVSLLITDQ